MKLIVAMQEEGKIFTADHLLSLREERIDGKNIQVDVNNAKLMGLVEDLEASDRLLILRAKNTGSWINACGITVNYIVLAATEFCYLLCARYDVTPPPRTLIKLYVLYKSFSICSWKTLHPLGKQKIRGGGT